MARTGEESIITMPPLRGQSNCLLATEDTEAEQRRILPPTTPRTPILHTDGFATEDTESTESTENASIVKCAVRKFT
jgi:hypothetical protein